MAKTSVFGVMRTIKALLPNFREAGGGTIINITNGDMEVAPYTD